MDRAHTANGLAGTQPQSPPLEAARSATALASSAGVEAASLAYAAALLIFLFGPPLLAGNSSLYPLLRWGEILDLFAPVVVLPLAWLLLMRVSGEPLGPRKTVAFLLLGAVWVEGHSIHLAANAIGHYFPQGVLGTDLVYFLDEELGHALLHGAIVGVAALILFRGARAPRPATSGWQAALVLSIAATLYGFTFFAMTIEGQTVQWALPAATVLTALPVTWLKGARDTAIAEFFVYGHGAALLFTIIWAALNGGALPEFSKLGYLG